MMRFAGAAPLNIDAKGTLWAISKRTCHILSYAVTWCGRYCRWFKIQRENLQCKFPLEEKWWVDEVKTLWFFGVGYPHRHHVPDYYMVPLERMTQMSIGSHKNLHLCFLIKVIICFLVASQASCSDKSTSQRNATRCRSFELHTTLFLMRSLCKGRRPPPCQAVWRWHFTPPSQPSESPHAAACCGVPSSGKFLSKL